MQPHCLVLILDFVPTAVQGLQDQLVWLLGNAAAASFSFSMESLKVLAAESTEFWCHWRRPHSHLPVALGSAWSLRVPGYKYDYIQVCGIFQHLKPKHLFLKIYHLKCLSSRPGWVEHYWGYWGRESEVNLFENSLESDSQSKLWLPSHQALEQPKLSQTPQCLMEYDVNRTMGNSVKVTEKEDPKVGILLLFIIWKAFVIFCEQQSPWFMTYHTV